MYILRGNENLKKTEIIKKNYEFKYFFKKGKAFSGELINVFVFNSYLDVNRLGIAVSKRIGGSVVRNRVKRFIREAYTDIEERITVNCNMLIVWKKTAKADLANFYDIREDLINLLIKSGNLKGN